ncbi:MAG: hypothetical protein JWO55_291 [Candidatus Saccharibacteria bacterium]|nr:hypothetical protein [Candidatus Saccharibacteria bacterium]
MPIEAHKEPPPMSPNPEQIPKSSETEVPVPHSGKLNSSMREVPVVPDLPDLTEEHVNNTTAADTVYDNFGGDETTLSPAEKAEFDQWRQRRAEKAQTAEATPTPEFTPADDTPTRESIPVKKKNKLARWALAGLGASLVFAASTAVYVNAITSGITNSTDKDLPPAPETNNSAAPIPGLTGETAAPTPDKLRTVTEADIASYQENVESTVFTIGEHGSEPKVLDDFVSAFNKMINYQPSDEELEKSKDLVSPTSGMTGSRAAAEMYRNSFKDMFASEGDFYRMLQATGASNFDKWLQTKEAGDENLYTMKFSLDEESRLVITSNVNKTSSLPKDPVSTIYTLSPNMKLDNLSAENRNPDERRWRWTEGILTKYGEGVNE